MLRGRALLQLLLRPPQPGAVPESSPGPNSAVTVSEALGASVLLPIKRGNGSDGRETPQPQSGDPHPQSRRHHVPGTLSTAFIHQEQISGSSEHQAEGASEHPPLTMPRSPASEGEERGASLPEVAQEVIEASGRSPQCWHWHLAVDVWPAGALLP